MSILRVVRRVALKLLPGLLALAIVLVAAAGVVGRSRWITQRVRQMLTIELARATGREVRCGEVHGDLFRGVIADNVAVGDRLGLAHGTVMSADEVRVKYRLGALLRGQVSTVGSISRVTVVRPTIRAMRQPDGLVDVIRMFRRPPTAPPARPEHFTAPIIIDDGSVEYLDLALPTRNGRRFSAKVENLDATITSPRPALWRIALRGTNPQGLLNQVEGEVLVGTKPTFFIVRANANEVNIRPWADWFTRVTGVTVLGGVARVSGSVYGVREPGPNASGRHIWTYGRNLLVDVQTANVKAAALRGGTAVVSGRARYTGGAIQLTDASVRLPWGRGTGSGTISGIAVAEPSLDMTVHMGGVDLNGVKKLVSLPAQVRAIQPGGPATGELHILGPLRSPTVAASVDLPQGAKGEEATTGLGPWKATRIHAEGTVLALARPAITADITAADAGLQTDAGSAWQSWAPFQLGTTTASSVLASVTVAGSSWAGDLRVGNLVVPGIPGFDLKSADARVGNGRFRARMAAAALGGTWQMALAGALSRRPSVSLQGEAMGVDLAQVHSLHWRDEKRIQASVGPLQEGRADVRFVANMRAPAPKAASADEGPARHATAAVAADLTHVTAWDRPLPPTRATATVSMVAGPKKGWALGELAFAARGADARGEAWATGTVHPPAAAEGPPGQRLVADVEFAGRRLDVAELAKLVPRKGVSGDASAAGSCRAVYDPGRKEARLYLDEAQARLAVARPRYEKYTADALAATVHGDLDKLIIDTSRVTQGHSAASLSGTISKVTDPSAGRSDPSAKEPPKKDARKSPVYALRLKATTTGSRIEDWLAAAGREEQATGALSADVSVSGTSEQPAAEGNAQVANAEVRHYEIDSAKGAFQYRDRVLTVPSAQVAAYGGQGTLTSLRADFGENGKISGGFRISQMRLDRVADLVGWDVQLGGVARARGRLSGPIDDVSFLASLEATKPSVKGVEADSLSAELAGSKEGVLVSHAAAKALGGSIVLSDAAYDFEPQAISGDVAFDGLGGTQCLDALVKLASKDSRDAAERKKRFAKLRDELHASLGGRATVSGSMQKPAGDASVTLSTITYQGKYVPDTTARFHFTRDRLSDATLNMVEDDNDDGVAEWRVRAAGDLAFAGPIALDVSGSAIPIKFLARWLPGYFRVGGTADFAAKVTGRPSSPVIDGNLDIKSPRFGSSELAGLHVPRLRVEEGRLAVALRDMPAGHQAYSLQADVTLPFTWHGEPHIPSDKPIQVNADLARLPLALVPPVMNEVARLAALTKAAHSGKAVPDEAALPPTFWGKLKDVAGTVEAHNVVVAGPSSAPQIGGDVSVTGGQIGYDEWPTKLTNIASTVHFRRSVGEGSHNTINVETLGLHVGDVAVSASGHMDRFDALNAAALQSAPFQFRVTASAAKQDFGHGLVAQGVDALVNITRNGSAPAGKNDHAAPLVFDVDHVSAGLKSGRAVLSGSAQISNYRLPSLQDNTFDLRLALEDVRTSYRPYFDGRLTTVEPITVKNPAPGQPAVLSGTVEVYDADFSQPSPFFRRRPTPEKALFGAPTSWPSPVLNLWVRVGRRVDAQLAPLPTLSDITRRGAAAAGGSRFRTYLVHVPIARGKDFLAIRGTPQEPQIVLQARGRGGQLFPGDLAIQIDQYSYEAKIYPASAPELANGATLNQLRSLPPLASGGGRGATQARVVDGQVTQYRIEEVQRRPGERIPLAVSDYLYAHAPIQVGQQSVAFIVDGPVQSATALDVPWRTEPPIDEDQVVRGLGADRILAGGVIGETPLVAALAQAGLNVSSGLLFGTIENALRRTGAVDDVSFQGIVEGEPKIQVGKTVLRNLYLSYTRTLVQHSTATHDYELSGSYLFRRNLDVSISTDEQQDVAFGLHFRKRF